MIKCTKCGSDLQKDSVFCNKCGTKVNQEMDNSILLRIKNINKKYILRNNLLSKIRGRNRSKKF